MLKNPCDQNNFIFWLLANSYIYDQYKNIQCLFSQNVNFRLNTLLRGALQLQCKVWNIEIVDWKFRIFEFFLILPCNFVYWMPRILNICSHMLLFKKKYEKWIIDLVALENNLLKMSFSTSIYGFVKNSALDMNNNQHGFRRNDHAKPILFRQLMISLCPLMINMTWLDLYA